MQKYTPIIHTYDTPVIHTYDIKPSLRCFALSGTGKSDE